MYGIPAGIIGGYLYYYFIGCNGGSCAITSNPYASMIYGGIFGVLLFNTIQDFVEKRKIKTDNIKEAEKAKTDK